MVGVSNVFIELASLMLVALLSLLQHSKECKEVGLLEGLPVINLVGGWHMAQMSQRADP